MLLTTEHTENTEGMKMSLLRPRDIQAMYGITVGSWRHAQKTMDLEPVFLRAGAKPMYRAEVIVAKFGKPKGFDGINRMDGILKKG